MKSPTEGKNSLYTIAKSLKRDDNKSRAGKIFSLESLLPRSRLNEIQNKNGVPKRKPAEDPKQLQGLIQKRQQELQKILAGVLKLKNQDGTKMVEKLVEGE